MKQEVDNELLDLYKKLQDDNTKLWSERVDLIHEYKRSKNPYFSIGGLTINPDCNASVEDLCHDLFEMEYACDRGDCEEVDPEELLI